MRIVIALVVIFGVGIVSQVYRSVTGAGDYTSIDELTVGQCFDLFEESSSEIIEVGAADVLPCNEPHDFEMVATGDFIGQQAYSETLFDTGLDRCLCWPSPTSTSSRYPRSCSSTFLFQPKTAGRQATGAISVTST